MKVNLGQSEIRVSETRVLRLRDACGRQVECLEGTLWITSEGEFADIHLQRGERHVLTSNRLVIVGSIDEGRLRFT